MSLHAHQVVPHTPWSFAVGPYGEVRFYPAGHMPAPEEGSVRRAGRHYVAYSCRANGRTTVTLTNATPPSTAIDYDDAWKRRLELASMFDTLFEDTPDVDPVAVRRQVPRALLVPTYLEALPAGSVEADVWRTLSNNTRARLRTGVEARLRGEVAYDTAAYALNGVAHPGYSHTAHFAWIYATEFQAIDALLDKYPGRELTVVDLGTGCGHFLATLAHHLRIGDRLGRVRLVGLDACSDRLRLACAALEETPDARAEFVAEDLRSPTFADRLRRLRPDVVVANHVLEHLEGEVVNRYLQDWLLAARLMLAVSVPLRDDPARSISEHAAMYTAESVTALAGHMALRVGHAVEVEDIARTHAGGLIMWSRPSDVVDWGGFSCTTVSLAPRPSEVRPDPILDDFVAPFDPARFAVVRRAPRIGMLRDGETFARIGQPRQVRQLLIKVPGTDVRIPAELSKFTEAIQLIIDHNAAANRDYHQAYAYLNVFQGRTGFSSYRGLSLSRHGDQLQSLHTAFAYKPDWSYIVSSTLPTMLYEQAFDVRDAVARHRADEPVDLYDYFNAQANETYLYRSDDFGIYLLSPYVVHSAAVAHDDIERVFLKVAFSTKRLFDNRELRRNPAFDIDSWYLADTVGRIDGWLSYGHWNERFLKEDVCPGWTPQPVLGA